MITDLEELKEIITKTLENSYEYQKADKKEVIPLLTEFSSSKDIIDLVNFASHLNTLDVYINDIMNVINTIMEGYGFEHLENEHMWISHYWMYTIGLYVNMGDTYDETIVYDTSNNEFSNQSWGSFMESFDEKNPTFECEICHDNYEKNDILIEYNDKCYCDYCISSVSYKDLCEELQLTSEIQFVNISAIKEKFTIVIPDDKLFSDLLFDYNIYRIEGNILITRDENE